MLGEELDKRVDESYEGKTESSKEKVMFTYLLLENNDISYVELYVSDNKREWIRNDLKQVIWWKFYMFHVFIRW